MPSFGTVSVDEKNRIVSAEIVSSIKRAEREQSKRFREIEARWAKVEASWQSVPHSERPASHLEQAAFIGSSLADFKVVKLAPQSREDAVRKSHKSDDLTGRKFAAITERDGRTYFVEVVYSDDAAIIGIRVDGYGQPFSDKLTGNGQKITFDRSDIVSAIPLRKVANHPLLQY